MSSGLGPENRKYDERAKLLYDLRRNDKKTWPTFAFLKRKERDYWRALAQISIEEELW